MSNKLTGFIEHFHGNEIVMRVDDDISQEFIDLITEEGDLPLIDVIINDPRNLTPQQRKFGYALIGDISEHTGHTTDYLKIYFKFLFEGETGVDFSFSSSSRIEAVEFLNFLIDFCFEWGVPMPKRAILPENLNRHLYNCIKFRNCAVCGKQGAEIHHFEAIGRRKRKLVDHREHTYIALCTAHHQAIHTMTWQEFSERWHGIQPIELDETTLQRLGIMSAKRMQEIDEGR
ncbi:MAG: hypothetical protein LBV67_07165 [Streptococcaceae bacterium]|jgi:hypothetical protein|nr:hypothetical protein [Streptococcaceae bacterium]